MFYIFWLNHSVFIRLLDPKWTCLSGQLWRKRKIKANLFEQITNNGGFAALREIADTFKTKQHTGFWDVLATPFF